MHLNALTVLRERGFVQQVTDAAAVDALFQAGPVQVYVGYDPTADSLHVGNLVTIMALKHLALAGHKPICLLGGGTAMVGDPSGKTELRQMLDVARIDANAQTLAHQLQFILADSPSPPQFVNNGDWLRELNYITFLRDIGRHFSVNRMLSMEAYKARLARGLSFIEFNYQLLQAYDYLQLRKRFDCRLQMGGDDQWGNILAGIDLCRRIDNELVHGLTMPLLTTASGAKMGKTASGAVWLAAEKLSPYDYYQYWINTEDADVARFLAIFTLLPMPEIAAVGRLEGAALNLAKAVLAFESTAIVHGLAAAQQAHQASQGAFGGRAIAADILPSSRIARVASDNAADMPTVEIHAADASADGPAGVMLAEVLVQAKFATSKNDARRLIGQGAVRLGELAPQDPQFVVRSTHFSDGVCVLRAGKKKACRLIWR